jgi:hypothetical protein
MASKLFIFAIGGTGSRVVKALTMLLASGVELKNTSQVIPIIVDPHKSNDDLKRTENLLKSYEKIRESLTVTPDKDAFFGTEIKTLKSIVKNDETIENTYTFDLKGVGKQTFGEYIGFDDLSGKVDNHEMYTPNKDLAKLLFSKKNIEAEMDIGFVGNPNMGSVVLNQFRESNEFKQFASNFAENDRIFIISSIFGGTGAAGFPIILKNIRNAEAGEVDNSDLLKNAKIGALTVLPYFGIEPNEEKRVDKATFFSKTKAALQYYNKGVNKSINRLYYIGDILSSNYKYDPGENGQKNDAHFVELAAAMAIVDFASIAESDLVTSNGLPSETIYKEFGLENDEHKLLFSDLSIETQALIARKLSKLTLLLIYIKYSLNEKDRLDLTWLQDIGFTPSFLSSNFYSLHLQSFMNDYANWLNEMNSNTRSFQPFNISTELENFIVGINAKRTSLISRLRNQPANMNGLYNSLNKVSYTKGNIEDKFLTIIERGADLFLDKYFDDYFKNYK